METNPLRLYVDKDSLVSERSHISLLYPFFGLITKATAPYEAAAWRLHGFDKTCFTLVDNLQEAEYILSPYPYRWVATTKPEIFSSMCRKAQAAQKLLLLDDMGDIHGPLAPEYAVLLRADGYRFIPESRTVIVPLPAEDLLETYFGGKLLVREKSSQPSIGWVGWSHISLKSYLRTYVKELPIRIRALFDRRFSSLEKGVLWRIVALRALTRTSGINMQFIIRKTFGGRTDTAQNASVWRREFVENLQQCDYALCIKGDANVSFRFYEALSLGKIPVLVDTEMRLPLEDQIDYQSFCVIVPWKQINKIGEILKTFHASCTPEHFREMQIKARTAYEQYLRIDAFSPYLVQKLREFVQKGD